MRKRILLGALAASLALSVPVSAGTVVERWSVGKLGAHPGAITITDGKLGKHVNVDLSALPKGTKVLRANLRIVRTRPITGADDEAMVNVDVAWAGVHFTVPAPLAVRGPWYDHLDATSAARAGVHNRALQLLVKACPLWKQDATSLDIYYQGAPKNVPQQVTGVNAFHRAGQTFITWKEIEDLVGKDAVKWRDLKALLDRMDKTREVRYCVYRHTDPITADNIHGAERIATVRPLSCWNVNGRNIERPIDDTIASKYFLGWGHGNPFGRATPDGRYGLDCPVDRLGIRDGEKPLPRGTGLYVHTPDAAGDAYYAVVTSVNGTQNTKDFSAANALTRPVAEVKGAGEPVLQGELPRPPFWSYPGKRLHHVRWVAPPLVNLPSQYYNWSVALPPKLTNGHALELCFHRDRGSYWRTHYRIERDSIVLCPHDFPVATWWYGYHESLGTLKSFRQGVVHNYTERRLLAFIDWAAKKWPVDRNRVLVTGTAYSGGSGALHLGLKHPGVFALICSGHGIPDYAGAIRDTKGQRRKRTLDPVQRVCGKLEWDLKAHTGKSVWDELNLTKLIRESPATADLPLVAMSAQHYVARGLWPGYHQFFNTMLEKRHALMATFGWYGARIVPVSRTGTSPATVRLDIARDRSLLAFRGPGTGVLQKPKGGMGGFNMSFRWKDVVDTADRYEVTVFWAHRGDKIKTPVTIRRPQAFKVEVGKTYAWVNRSLDGKTELQKGQVTVGDDGLLTVPGFVVHKAGTRLGVRTVGR